jgi:hypothetical protein
MAAEPEPFLKRWSRRKQAERRGAPEAEPEPAGSEVAAAAEPPAPLAEPPAAEPPPELPDPDTLGADADFRPFLAAGVPRALRNRALRRLWRVNPIIGSHDGLDDTFKDFTDARTVFPDLKTAYRVGRGLLADPDEGRAGTSAPRPEIEGAEKGGRVGLDDAGSACRGAGIDLNLSSTEPAAEAGERSEAPVSGAREPSRQR